MNKQNYKWVVYFIGITILITIAAQVYWNYREYQINKQNLISKVQLSLDNAVEAYFVNLTKSGIITFTSVDSIGENKKTDTIIVKTNSRRGLRKKLDSTLQNIAILENDKPLFIETPRNDPYPFFTRNKMIPKNIDSLMSKVFISISRDTLDLNNLDTYLNNEFNRNNIDVTYGLKYSYGERTGNDEFIHNTIEYKLEKFPEKHLTTTSKSTFLPHRSKLELFFTNETKLLLRNSFISILLSLLLSASIIASIIYLLKTIYKQKQLAEVKNDLINNITHEFKTPIATISTALEALKNFNALDDKVKTEKYISIANSQVSKLHVMVEKILETASLNQENLVLTKEPIELAKLIENVIEKYELINTNKKFNFKNSIGNVVLNLDKFHFENAIGNIIDNAIKYGGNKITIELVFDKKNIVILIKDNGNGIHKNEKDKVFDQFYRIPTGNTHNVKGFGIGLFYTKNIIEKHKGKIDIIYDKNNNTLFKIELLNE
ncbi:two-component system phosphate regulon sensor histidine kinase PhoR [Lutibacter oceani]|uniref:histidine kinase n=1 Tax=Lutibacter oceani TaxID=1853311 RepID=A0A3D9RUJ4_9FLAO|nr:HAMP domain-containing sensor histidine kinase [Lutibacter oceani]REE83158.1 two-component system phosphate regulon sensor histidine kinase PhoR [Lutibacter oceani]